MSILGQPEVSIYDSRRGGPCVRRSDGGRQASIGHRSRQVVNQATDTALVVNRR